MINNRFIIYFILIVSFIFVSCTSIRKPQNIYQNIDYSDTEVLNNEIERINELLEQDTVKALWRALLINQQDLIQNCYEQCVIQFEDAVERNDFFEAQKLYRSIICINGGFASDKISLYKTLEDQNAVLLNNKSKTPANITECMQAAVTIWVDRGLKIQNGAGYQDLVIGSGFFIDSRGYVVTNYHVIQSLVDPKQEGYSKLYIKLFSDSETKIPAKVQGYDEQLDLAILKVEIEPRYVFKLGSSKSLTIGDKVSAIGAPIGLEGTLTSGIISSTDRKLLTLGQVFQIDAAVNSGNSGGPLIDQNMNVQAIVFAGFLQFQGLNFAIPVEYLNIELPFLLSGQEIIHSWIGCYGHTYKKASVPQGLELQYTMPGSTGFLSGLQQGDIITKIDDFTITTLEDFHSTLMHYMIGTLVKCTFLRDFQEQTCYLYLDKRPKAPAVEVYNTDHIENSFLPLFGMALVADSTSNRRSYRVTKVLPGTNADNLSFSENDKLTVKELKFDNQNEYILTNIVTQRRKKAFLDISIIMGTNFDTPYYF